jgi:hypothetical protein
MALTRLLGVTVSETTAQLSPPQKRSASDFDYVNEMFTFIFHHVVRSFMAYLFRPQGSFPLSPHLPPAGSYFRISFGNIWSSINKRWLLKKLKLQPALWILCLKPRLQERHRTFAVRNTANVKRWVKFIHSMLKPLQLKRSKYNYMQIYEHRRTMLELSK